MKLIFTILTLVALTASAQQLTSPRAKPTPDKPMAKAAPAPKALAVVPTPVPTPGLIVRKLSWPPVAQAVRYDLKWYPHIGDESTGTDPYYDPADYIQIPPTNYYAFVGASPVIRYTLSLTGSPPWKLELQSINSAGMASTNVTIIFWDQLALDYYRQVADSIAGPWREDAQPFSTVTNPVGVGVTRIRVDRRRL